MRKSETTKQRTDRTNMSKLALSLSGTFIRCFGTGAIIVHNLTGYRLISDERSANIGEYEVGFPKNALGKVAIVLKEANIPFSVYDGVKEISTFEGRPDEPSRYDELSVVSTVDEIADLISEITKKYEKKTGAENRRKVVLLKEAEKIIRNSSKSQVLK